MITKQMILVGEKVTYNKEETRIVNAHYVKNNIIYTTANNKKVYQNSLLCQNPNKIPVDIIIKLKNVDLNTCIMTVAIEKSLCTREILELLLTRLNPEREGQKYINLDYYLKCPGKVAYVFIYYYQ